MDKSIRIVDSEVLAGSKYNLRKVVFDYTDRHGQRASQTRFVFDRGNGAAILLYNRAAGTVILTRQFRLPTYLNGNPTGMLIEVCAGLLDKDDPEACIKKEAEEEAGFVVRNPRKVFEAYMSPGSVTEKLFFFVAEYEHEHRISAGGGDEKEGEDIEVLEIPLEKALEMIALGEIRDAKTIMLLQYAKLEKLLE